MIGNRISRLLALGGAGLLAERRETMNRLFLRLASLALIMATALQCDTGNPVDPDSGGNPPTGTVTAERSVGAPVSSFSAEIPFAYYGLSLEFSKRTAGFSPPVQSRAYAYMGLALYEALVNGMPHHRSVASQLNGIGALPAPSGVPYYWPLVANAALAEVMRGLWGGSTNRAAENIADLDALEVSFEAQYREGQPPGLIRNSV